MALLRFFLRIILPASNSQSVGRSSKNGNVALHGNSDEVDRRPFHFRPYTSPEMEMQRHAETERGPARQVLLWNLVSYRRRHHATASSERFGLISAIRVGKDCPATLLTATLHMISVILYVQSTMSSVGYATLTSIEFSEVSGPGV